MRAIFTKKGSDQSYLKIRDSYGGYGISLDESYDDYYSESIRESQYVELYDNETPNDSSDDKYYIAVKESYSRLFNQMLKQIQILAGQFM